MTHPTPMLPRNRVLAALNFQPVDRVPLQIHPSPGGLYEHGQKLLDLMKACGDDFGDLADLTLPRIPPEDFDPDGRYHRIHTDDWGTTWEYRLYGVWGHRIGYPLADLSRLNDYQPPIPPRLEGEALAQARQAADIHKQRYPLLCGGLSLFETLQSLRPFEDVLIEIMQDTPEINRIADLLVEYNLRLVENALAVGTDIITVGDDFGTQANLLLSPRAWRRFFLPRYRTLFAPVITAGKSILFHSCGQVEALLPDLHALGVNAIWPQLPLYNPRHLARTSREYRLAVLLHPDRGELMQRGTPRQVRDAIHRLVDEFDCLSGGSWLYIEIDPGFRWDTVQALFETAMELRATAASPDANT
ncbi:MAG: hypothetical protein HPY85_12245 [Anaerolineae bacterium]|nr:hypothetical protein [Anaerolineae bacterium]